MTIAMMMMMMMTKTNIKDVFFVLLGTRRRKLHIEGTRAILRILHLKEFQDIMHVSRKIYAHFFPSLR